MHMKNSLNGKHRFFSHYSDYIYCIVLEGFYPPLFDSRNLFDSLNAIGAVGVGVRIPCILL